MFPFKSPFTMICSGPTGCGKSCWVKKFFRHIDVMADTKFARKIVYYAEWQNGYLEYGDDVEFHEGLPQNEDFVGDSRPKLIVIDDLMRESSNNVIVDLFTKGSHHKNISVIFITQNLFHQGPKQRDISLNANYIVIFKNPRDRAQIQHMARQVFPAEPKFLQDAYYDATSVPHGYLLLDLKQDTIESCRVRTNIFPDDPYNYVYLPMNIKRGAHDELPVVRI